MRSIELRDVDLADLIGLVATTSPDTAEAVASGIRLATWGRWCSSRWHSLR